MKMEGESVFATVMDPPRLAIAFPLLNVTNGCVLYGKHGDRSNVSVKA